eukprot:TRINITY_DN2706_c0_g1_i2.p1 TRINITY_DN2706_c0_g1~~TRINITY_DN2706_c0_g1_i2.p1  ORF type:complete len:165 (+),score=74.53 TRINITY_DN2706_c0_g1_i2:34-495(+)
MGSVGDAVHKRTLYVGGLDEHVTEPILHAAFLPFGDIVDVQIPMDSQTNKHRGFGFVTFELEEDVRAAMENMHNSEIYGRVLKVNIAKPQVIVNRHKAVWEEAGYFDKVKDADAPATAATASQQPQKDKEKAREGGAAATPTPTPHPPPPSSS